MRCSICLGFTDCQEAYNPYPNALLCIRYINEVGKMIIGLATGVLDPGEIKEGDPGIMLQGTQPQLDATEDTESQPPTQRTEEQIRRAVNMDESVEEVTSSILIILF